MAEKCTADWGSWLAGEQHRAQQWVSSAVCTIGCLGSAVWGCEAGSPACSQELVVSCAERAPPNPICLYSSLARCEQVPELNCLLPAELSEPAWQEGRWAPGLAQQMREGASASYGGTVSSGDGWLLDEVIYPRKHGEASLCTENQDPLKHFVLFPRLEWRTEAQNGHCCFLVASLSA